MLLILKALNVVRFALLGKGVPDCLCALVVTMNRVICILFYVFFKRMSNDNSILNYFRVNC